MLERNATQRPSTSDLADQANVSIGTVYRYFADIDTVIEELRLAAVHDITAALAGGIGRALDQPPAEAMVTVVETLTTAFEKHAAVMRASSAAADGELGDAWREVEATLTPLARVLPSRLRPDLEEAQIDDLVFITMGATASLCLRIAVLRPPEADRDRLVATAARMLLAAFEGEPAGPR